MSTVHSSLNDDYAFYRVFGVPELLSLIYGFLNKADYVGVAYLSRRAFAYTAPFVWEDVDLMPLLLLIPESSAKTHHTSNTLDDTKIKYYTFEIPAVFDLSRFKLYSQYTRVLRTSMPYSVDFPEEFPNSNESLLPAETLVPNLESLLVCTYSYTRAKNVNWIYKFLTSRLREFRLLSVTGLEEGVRDPQLDLETYIGLLDKISTICPQIEVLHAHGAEDRQFPRKKHKNRPPETQPPMDVWDRSTALGRKHLFSLQHLRSLSISVPSLFPGLLQDLGELRHLEALFLHIDQDQSHSRDNEPIVLSDNSFVSLQHLTLSGSHPSALVHSPRSIFPNLRTATVHMRSFAGSNDWSRGIGLFSSFVDPELGQNSPDFVHLSIKPLKRGNNITLNWLPPGIFKHTSLKYLETSNVRLNFRSLIGWESFSAVVPHLEELTLWSQEIGMLMLSFIARALPYLRLLVLDALWPDSSVPGAAHFSGSLPVMTPIKIKCRIGRPSGYASGWSKKLVSKTAGCIYAFRPNARLEVRDKSQKLDVDFAADLNAAMQRLKRGVV